jgi:hypothetical protein
VEDFATWKTGYDSAEALEGRRNGGVRADGVYLAVDDPHDVTVWHDFETEDAARAFVASDWLHDVMREIGVSGEPTIWFTHEA